MSDGIFRPDYKVYPLGYSSVQEIERFRKDAKVYAKGRLSKGMVDLLVDVLANSDDNYVTRVEVQSPKRVSGDPGYFYWYTKDGGVFDPEDIHVMQEELRLHLRKNRGKRVSKHTGIIESFQGFLESIRHEEKKIDLSKCKYAYHWVNEGNLFSQVYDDSNLSQNDHQRFILRKFNGKAIEMPNKFPPKRFVLGGDENESLKDETEEFNNAVCLTVDPEYYQAGFTGESNVCIVFEITDLGKVRDLTDNGEAEIRVEKIDDWVTKAKAIFIVKKTYEKGDGWEGFFYRGISEWLPVEVKAKVKTFPSAKSISQELKKWNNCPVV